MALKEICGCIHLHTTFSDGDCDYPTLIKTAAEAGLDYVCVTDHMNLKGLSEGYQGLREGVFVIVGYEHNDERNLNHYLAFGTNETAKNMTDPQKYINQIKKMGGIGFLAHPAEKRDYIRKLPPYPWTRWDVKGFDGIELWNQMSDWMEQLRGWQSVTRLFYPRRFLGNVDQELLNRWDELNRVGFISGIGGVDAHSRKLFSIGPFCYRVFPIKVELKGIRTHLFVEKPACGDETKMREAVLRALKDGKGFISNFRLGDARGTQIFLQNENGRLEYPGYPSAAINPPSTINVNLPHKAKIRLLRNGSTIQEIFTNKAQWPIAKPGVYRIEVYKRSSAWIYSNPFPVGKYPI
ncbi:MAG: PHP domain-containing protein [Chitinispirillales bacterium]|jgi:hypothetical protein|nr:PHP domain-containing protein [Chitinispirillales bacterium]